jgi:hypothetical protein
MSTVTAAGAGAAGAAAVPLTGSQGGWRASSCETRETRDLTTSALREEGRVAVGHEQHSSVVHLAS